MERDAKEGIVARKTVKARLGDDSRLQTLYSEWNRLVWKAFWMRYTTNFSRKAVVDYHKLAYQTPLAKYYTCAAIRLVESKAKAYQSLRKRRNAGYQREFDEPVQLTNPHTYQLSEKGDRICSSISLTPREPIKTILIFGADDENEGLLRKAIGGELRTKGARLLRRDSRWWLYVTVEKGIEIPDATLCETIVGVDVGKNRLIVATAMTRGGKIMKPLFVNGGLVKHLELRRRRKIAELRSRGFNVDEAQRYYNVRIDELIHTASKQVVEYAKRFPMPVIVLEQLRLKKSTGKSKRWRYLLAMWARRRLQRYIEYKALWEGIPVVYVSARGTSQHCHRCGAKGDRRSTTFRCPRCGKIFDADVNASLNLVHRFDEWKASQLESCAL